MRNSSQIVSYVIDFFVAFFAIGVVIIVSVSSLGKWEKIGIDVMAACMGVMIIAIHRNLKNEFVGAIINSSKSHEEMLEAVLSKLSPATRLELMIQRETVPTPVKNILNNEALWQKEVEQAFRSNKDIPISTARMYDALLCACAEQGNVYVCDQDITRWFELTDDRRTSTVFNYSAKITAIGYHKRKSQGDCTLQRLFIVHPKFAPFDEKDEDALQQGMWDLLSPSTRTLIALWAVERAAAGTGAIDRLQSKFVVCAPDDTRATALNAQRDWVLIGKHGVSFVEDIDFSSQGSVKTFEDSPSWIEYEAGAVKRKRDWFEAQWNSSFAKGQDQYERYMARFRDDQHCKDLLIRVQSDESYSKLVSDRNQIVRF